MAHLSVASFLTPAERSFAQFYHAIGRKDPAECYRRAFAEDKEHKKLSWNPATLRDRALSLLATERMRRYLEELDLSDPEAARRALSEQMRFGPATARVAAADKILKDEEKVGQRDAALAWAQILCEEGAEIVVPLPHRIEGFVTCPGCGESHRASLPLEVTAPLSDLFPSAAPEAQPEDEA